MQADVLIVTATKVESTAVTQVFQEASGERPKPASSGDRMYQDLGVVNGAKVFLAQSEVGSVGLGASLQTVQKGIAALSPAAVIMVGIAFGINADKQSIGDVLVSQRLWLYDLQRVGTGQDGKLEIIPRGDRPHASPRLMSWFQVADQHWDEARAEVRFGLILSGDKLVDNVDFRQQLRAFESEAIGGEMEGAGLYVACQDEKVDWILVKAICDWGDGNKAQDKDARQQLAAQNAASFVLHALQQAPFKRDGRRREFWNPMRDFLPTPGAAMNPAAANQAIRSTLPPQPYFFGREKELAIIADALSPDARSWGALIDGPGGIGKTALAVRAGHLAAIEHFPLKIFLSAKVRELTAAGEQALQDYMLPNFVALVSELARELGDEGIARIPENERANAVRRTLAGKQALIIVDNVETFGEPECVRLYQFLSRLPEGCKAIVTSRRRTDIDARIIRLDRLALKDALDLMAELAKSNRHLARAGDREREELYGITGGNPLLIKWVAGQLGRTGSRCRTIAEAYEFMKSAPKDNDPLEYIFGDLLDTFTEEETAVLAALTHFTLPARVEWIAELAELPKVSAQTALEDLTDRALLVSDEQGKTFLLPALAATFLRRKRPESVAQTGNLLAQQVYALVMEHGGENYERFPKLEAEWPRILAALPLFAHDDNARLQTFCYGLFRFLDFAGHWDEMISFYREAEERASNAKDFYNAGWRAFEVGWVYSGRGQGAEALNNTNRCETYWQSVNTPAINKTLVFQLRGIGYTIEKNYPAAIATLQTAITIQTAIDPESENMANILNSLAEVEREAGEYSKAAYSYSQALQIAKKKNYREGLAIYTGNVAELAIDRQDWPAAETLAREALNISESIGRQELIGEDCWILAKALVQQGHPQEGLSYAFRSVEILARLRLPNLEKAQAVLRECEEAI
jgi:nucleoside phosphorylase/tetratricopeptide (TPR) repeat protein